MKNKLGKNESLVEYHSNGNVSYEYNVNSYGYSWERTCDENGKVLTYIGSNGRIYECTYDENGNRLTYKVSDNSNNEVKKAKKFKKKYYMSLENNNLFVIKHAKGLSLFNGKTLAFTKIDNSEKICNLIKISKKTFKRRRNHFIGMFKRNHNILN